MWSFKKILVPTDFSKTCEEALEAAITLAKKFDAAIVLMHAYQMPVYPYPTGAMVSATDLAGHIEKGAERALQVAASRCAESGVPATTAVRAGTPWEQIVETAREVDADLIVIGSRGLRGLPRALLGSTAERVVRYSHVPVMTLHGPAEQEGEDRPRDDGKGVPKLTDRWLSG